MLLIDSAVWIDYFRGTSSVETDLVEQWLKDGRPLATTGIVLQEVLQGCATERDFQVLRARLSRLAYLREDKRTHISAAALFCKARKRGITVPAVDALIAAVAIEHSAQLLTSDATHFRALSNISKLKLLITP